MIKMNYKYIVFYEVYSTSKGNCKGNGYDDVTTSSEISSSSELDEIMDMLIRRDHFDVVEAKITHYKLISATPVEGYQGMSDQSSKSDM